MAGRASPETRTTCPYCGVGCGVIVSPADDGQSAKVRGDPDHPSNFGQLCSKGSALGETLDFDERLLFPEINGNRVAWDTALDAIADGFSQKIADYGPDSVAFYVSGQLLTEDYYIANKLMKGFIGSANIDTNSRLCMASSVVGHKRAFGTDTVPGNYQDLEDADLIVMVGSNFAWCHPVLHQRVLAAKAKRGTKLVVIDPRQTATSSDADLHLAIRPGSDVALYNWLLWRLDHAGAADAKFVEDHTSGMLQALMVATAVDDESVCEQTGLDIDALYMLLDLVLKTERLVTIYSQGVNQSVSGTDKVNAILNTHLLTGRIGRPGMGPFSITGQPNAMGGREVGGLANQLAGHMDFAPGDIDRVQRFWRAPRIAEAPGLKAVDLFDAVAEGKVKAIWIMATNPVVSIPRADRVKAALDACPLVVVSDIVSTSDTVKCANIVLPATGWGEKDGTVTNSERRISRQRAFLPPPGEARHDWQALCGVAQRMGFDGFSFKSAADIYCEHAALSAFENGGRRDFDIGAHAGIDQQTYDALSPAQWPLPAEGTKRQGISKNGGDHRFFGDGQFFTPDNRARFIPTPYKPPRKKTSRKRPLILNTGRVRDHWHTMTRTGKVARLSTHLAEPFLEIHPEDAIKYGITAAALVQVDSVHGRAILRALLTRRMTRGQVFAPIHWTERYSSAGKIDALVGPQTDPLSGQPDAKFTPVTLKPLKPAWYACGVFTEEPDGDLLSDLQYWALARTENGWRGEFAGSLDARKWVSTALPFEDSCEITLPNGGIRRAQFSEDRLAGCLYLSSAEPVSVDRAWLAGQLADECQG
ncbi:MAG: nitrate reductase [Pseudomonadota bacterium]